MSDEMTSLIALPSDTRIQMINSDTALPVAYKKDPNQLHTPEVTSGGFTRLFPNFYELNHKNEVDPKNPKVKLKSKGTFTRYVQLPGQPKAALFNPEKVIFIPLDFKTGRVFFKNGYDPNSKSPPDCQSSNGIVPQTNKYANTCAECPFSKWDGNKPPKCSEKPEILGLDLTGSTVNDPELRARVTKEAFTIAMSKTQMQPINALKKKLNDHVWFEDGTSSPLDMTQYVVEMTADLVFDDTGKETAFCSANFNVLPEKIPFEISEQLLEMLNKEVTPGKTVRQMFIGNTVPHTGTPQGEADAVVETSSMPPVASVVTKAAVKESPVVESVAPAVTPPPVKEEPAPSEQVLEAKIEPPKVKGPSKPSPTEVMTQVAPVAPPPPSVKPPEAGNSGMIIF